MATKQTLARFAVFWVGVAALALGLLVQIQIAPQAASGLLRVRILDVGQGDAILVDTPSHHHLLVDGGPDESVVALLAQFLIPPERLDLVVATHNDADHIGGLPAVLGRFSVTEVWITGAIYTTETYERWHEALADSPARVQTVRAGHVQAYGATEVRVLHPSDDLAGRQPEENHDATIVLKVTYGATSLLLTGDLAFEHELALIDRDPTSLGASVLKVTHHGSAYGTSARFLEYVHPEIAVISVGEGNRYDHPTPETLERIATAGAKLHRTDHEGTVTILSDGLTVRFEP